MDPSFIQTIENDATKDLVKNIITIFNDLQEQDNSLAYLLVDYLLKHLGRENNIRRNLTATKSIQTEFNEPHNGWDMKDITNEVKEVAEQCMNETGLNYDKTSGTYYNSEEGYYYIPDYRLYYYPRLSAYYYYDDTTDSLKFHSTVAPGETASTTLPQDSQVQNIKLNTNQFDGVEKDKKVVRSVKVSPKRETNEEKEEGELSSSDEDVIMEETGAKVVFESGPKAFEVDHSKHNAPCIRMVIVKSSLEHFNAGTLFLITRDGATLGREGIHHEILLPDSNISKEHLKFQYVYKGDQEQRYAYEVTDLGSRNGTWVNGKRLSGPNEASKPEEITHGTIITIGTTTLLCHIHQGLDSCSECQTADTVQQIEGNKETHFTSKQQYHMQMKQMRYKYQLGVVNYSLPKGYTDRAKMRRDEVGSSHDSEKTEVSSVHIPMNKKNKGYNLLSKMGWKEGNTLGKNTTSVAQEPLYVEPKNDKAGFGA